MTWTPCAGAQPTPRGSARRVRPDRGRRARRLRPRRGRVSAVHVTDAARLVRLGLEAAPAGSRLHAVAEEAVPSREIAQAIGDALGVPVTSVAPEDAMEHFGFIGMFFGMDMAAESRWTRETFGWTPTGPGLLEDIKAGAYRQA